MPDLFDSTHSKLLSVSLILILLLSACGPAGQTSICHATSSETNPYEQITVDAHGLNGHDDHENDIIPAPAEGCPTSMQ